MAKGQPSIKVNIETVFREDIIHVLAVTIILVLLILELVMVASIICVFEIASTLFNLAIKQVAINRTLEEKEKIDE